MWRLRDRVYDDVRAGRIAKIDLVVSFIDDIERSIRYARYYTLINALISPVPPKEFWEQRRRFIEGGKKALSPDHLKLFEDYENESRDIYCFQLLFGSPLGWITFIVFLLSYLVVGLIKVGLADPLSYARHQTKIAVQKLTDQLDRIQEMRDHDADEQRPLWAC